MRKRPVGEVLAALRALGRRRVAAAAGRCRSRSDGTGSVRGGRVVIDASASSQFVSALLLAGARFDEGVDVRHEGKPVPSLPHIDMTVDLLRRHGVEVDDSDANRWAVAPGPVAARDHTIEPDLSNAAPFVALAAVTGGSVTVRDWPRSTTQAGDALREILTAMGCEVAFTDDGLRVTGTGRPARRRPRPARRGRADPGGRRPVRAGGLALAPARHRPHPRPTRPTGWPPWRPSSAASART